MLVISKPTSGVADIVCETVDLRFHFEQCCYLCDIEMCKFIALAQLAKINLADTL